MEKKTHIRIIIYCILFVGLVVGISVLLFPYFRRLSEPGCQVKLQQWVGRMGVKGLILILGIQILQVVIAFIPGEPIELLSGALYGTIGGMMICLSGCIFASAIIFTLSKQFGKKILYVLFSKEKVRTWKWLQDNKKCAMVTFILFLIPGTPKDMLTYIVGVTEMKIGKFIRISTLARIPSVITSTMIGSTMRHGDWQISLIVFVVTGIVGIVGIGFKERIIDYCRSRVSRRC